MVFAMISTDKSAQEPTKLANFDLDKLFHDQNGISSSNHWWFIIWRRCRSRLLCEIAPPTNCWCFCGCCGWPQPPDSPWEGAPFTTTRPPNIQLSNVTTPVLYLVLTTLVCHLRVCNRPSIYTSELLRRYFACNFSLIYEITTRCHSGFFLSFHRFAVSLAFLMLPAVGTAPPRHITDFWIPPKLPIRITLFTPARHEVLLRK